nr:cytochrome c oxidase, subunit VIb [Tanacetum cinerariifolium]
MADYNVANSLSKDYLLKEFEEAVKATKEVFVNENPSESDEQETTDDETVEIKHQEITDFQLQIKVGTALPDMWSITGVLQPREMVLLNVISLQNTTAHFAQVNGSTDGTSKGRMALFQVVIDETYVTGQG